MSKLYKGIDISLYQGDPDFAKVRDAGIDFIIFKASQGSAPNWAAPFVDPCFEKNVKRFAQTPGRIYGGSYHYFTATSVQQAIAEADFFVKVITPYRYNLQLWAAIDVEDAPAWMSYALLTDCVAAFCERVKLAGFRPLVYSSTWWLNNRFSVPAGVPIWEANWSRSTVPDRARVWQKGTAYVPGILGEVDYNLAYGIMGDADGDGQVNAKDVTAAMKYIVSGKKKPAINESQMDFDRDGKVTAKDVTALMKALV